MRPVIKQSFISVLSVAAVAAFALGGCSSMGAHNADPSAAATAESTGAAAHDAQAEQPEQLTITKTPESINGGKVKLPIKRNLIFTVEADADKWMARIDDPSIAEFVAGDGTTMPTIHPLAEGDTTVELTGPDGTTSSFTLIVIPGAR